MRTRKTVLALLAISVALTLWFIVSSYVTYAPNVSATAIQNEYIDRIAWFGSAIVVLQVVAILVLSLTRDSRSP